MIYVPWLCFPNYSKYDLFIFQAKVICSVRYIIDIVLVAIIIGGKAMQQVIGQFTDDFPQKTI